MRNALGILVVTAAATTVGIGACGGSDDSGGGAGTDPDAGGIQVDADQGCPAGKITSISGTIVSPAKSSPDPIYNAVAFVPSGDLAPFPRGVHCDKCGALEGTKVRVATLTGSDGKFKLEGVPSGKNIPFAVQIGRWRRKVILPEVKACEDNPIGPEFTRLPRNKEEGNIPLTAIVTGHADLLECTLRKIGIEDQEFVAPLPDGNGRIHVFKSLNGPDLGGGGTIGGSSLYKNLDFMKWYDQILLPCEGDARTTDKNDTAMGNLVAYANAGGKVFTTHYGYVWLQNSTEPLWKGLTTWATLTDSKASLPATIDQSFPKGKAMAEWLQNVGATKTAGQLDIIDARLDITSPVKAPAQKWITSDSPASTQHFTFNTPIDKPVAEQCGKVIYSDFHVAGLDDFSPITFPSECTAGPLTPQERVIEFMLFDLASCVQPDSDPPKIPK